MPPVGSIPQSFDIAMSAKNFSWPSGKKLILYFTNWGIYGRNFQVKDIPADHITGINYAFYDLRQDPNGFYVPTTGDSWADYEQRFTTPEKGLPPLDNWNENRAFYGNFGQLKKLKDSGKQFNIGLSIGGWSWSANFSPAVSSPAARKAFVDKIIEIFKTYPIFNRIDIDWEYISPVGNSYGMSHNKISADDPQNYAEFLKLLRETLDREGFSNYEMSMCTTASPERMGIMPIDAMVKYLDTINIMTYDHQDGNWGITTTGHNSNVYKTSYTQFSIEDSVKKMIELGVPSTKIVIGAAYYSRGFSNTDGMGKPCSGGSPDKSWESGIVDYKDLPLPGATEYYDEKAGAGYSYDPVKRVVNSYDTVRSVQEKANFIVKHNLGGIIVWEASGDRPVSSGKSLTKAMADILKNGKGIIAPTPRPTPNPPTPTPNPPKPTPAPPKPAPEEPTVPDTPSAPERPHKNGDLWKTGVSYKRGNVVKYGDSLYVCIIEHTSQADWTPQSPTLWKFLNKAPSVPLPQPDQPAPPVVPQPNPIPPVLVPPPTPGPTPPGNGTTIDWPSSGDKFKSITFEISNITFNR
jgi:chitinase